MSSVLSEVDLNPITYSVRDIPNHTDNSNLLLNYKLDQELDIDELAYKLEQSIFNISNPNSITQLQIDLENSFRIKRIPNLFSLTLKKDVSFFLINYTLYLQMNDISYSIELNKFKFIYLLINELKRINVFFNYELFDISYHQNYNDYKYYSSKFLEFNTNIFVEDTLTIDKNAFDLPEDIFISDVIFLDEQRNKNLKEVNNIGEYNAARDSKTDINANFVEYFLDKTNNKLYVPDIILNTDIAITGYKKILDFSWSEIKLHHAAHESFDKVIKQKNNYDLSKHGVKIYRQINELHSSFWGK